MNTWIKPNPSFDSDEALDKFLAEANGLILMFDAPIRYMFQEIPKFLVYALQMYMPNFGDKSELPFIVIGKKDQASSDPKKDQQSSQQQTRTSEQKFKPIIPWRSMLKTKKRVPASQRTSLEYLDLSNGDKNMIEDVYIELLKIICKDESYRIQEMPNKLTKRKGDGMPGVSNI